MKVNKYLMDKARFERKTISELTVAEFRGLMQQCMDADHNEVIRRKNEEIGRHYKQAIGIYDNQNPTMTGYSDCTSAQYKAALGPK
jgi:hypothetical protein